jgi:metallo-beta-lactamase family protein
LWPVGFKQLRLQNWEPLPVDPRTIDTVVLTHAHLDHSGYLPLHVRNGFVGRVVCTAATRDLCGILLPDSGHLEEREAEFADRHGFSKHRPALPLYTETDSRNALKQFAPIDFDQAHDLGDDTTLTFHYAGHILGAAIVWLFHQGTTIVFSGDLGRPNDPVMRAPAAIIGADYLVVESTYGNRTHDSKNPQDVLAEVITRTAARGGTVLIPAFAVGRAQSLLYHLYMLKSARRIPNLPVFLDSPMAMDAGGIFHEHRRDHRLSNSECRDVCSLARNTRSVEESKGDRPQSRARNCHLGKWHGNRWSGAAPSKGLRAGFAQHGAVRRIPSGRNAWLGDGRRSSRSQDPRKLHTGSGRGHESRHALRPR